MNISRADREMTLDEYVDLLPACHLARRERDALQAGPCVWTENENGAWETGCGHTWEFITDGPQENGAKYCIYCGHKIKEATG